MPDMFAMIFGSSCALLASKNSVSSNIHSTNSQITHLQAKSALNHEVLHGLNQAALDVASGRSLDRRVDKPLPPTHGVEEKFLGRQAPKVRVLHKAPRFRPVVVLRLPSAATQIKPTDLIRAHGRPEASGITS